MIGLIWLGLLQGGGAIVTIVGLSVPRKRTRMVEPGVSFTPLAVDGGAGLGLEGRF